MTVSLEDNINNILNDLRIAESDILAGKPTDLTPLETKTRQVYNAVSDNMQLGPIVAQSTLNRHLTTVLEGLDCLERLVTARKEGLYKPCSPPETA